VVVPRVDFSTCKARVREFDGREVCGVVLRRSVALALHRLVSAANETEQSLLLLYCVWVPSDALVQLKAKVVCIFQTTQLDETCCQKPR
jgi:hypothetical protein